MSVRRYRLVAGKHYEGQTVYRAGDVLESTRQLDVAFRNKFVEVSDVTPVNAPPDPKGLPPPTWRSPENPSAAQDKKILELQTKVQQLERELSMRDLTISSQKETIEFLETELEALKKDAGAPPVTPAPKASKKKAAPAVSNDDPFAAE